MKIYKCHTNKFVRKLEQIRVPGEELASNCADLSTSENDTENSMRDTLKHKLELRRETSNQTSHLYPSQTLRFFRPFLRCQASSGVQVFHAHGT